LAGPDRAELVYKLTNESFAEYRDVLQPPTGVLSETLDEVKAAIAVHGAGVAWIGDRAVGSVRFERTPAYLYVGRLSVLPAHRRMGVASALMEFAEAHARAVGLPAVKVEVRTVLTGNIAFFKGLGYIHTETNPHPRMPSATSETLVKILEGKS
jgi:GNAT superfamily N-acetyltransferase